MVTVPSTDVIFAFDRDARPVARITSGETVTFHTLDCFSGAIRSEDDLVTDIDFARINPATGPVYVDGAAPGDALAVTIHSIDVDPVGTMIVAPGFGLLGDTIDAPVTRKVPVDDEGVHIGGRVIDPHPMIGVIGCAPAGEPVATGTPHYHGGNMDCRTIAEGTTVYLPVQVDGALFALGDVHAAMADGEIGVSGVEIGARVTVTIAVVKNPVMPLPFLDTGDRLVTMSSLATADEAIRGAVDHMVDFLVRAEGMPRADAVMLCSAAANLRVCQVVDPNVTFRVEIPTRLVRSWDHPGRVDNAGERRQG